MALKAGHIYKHGTNQSKKVKNNHLRSKVQVLIKSARHKKTAANDHKSDS